MTNLSDSDAFNSIECLEERAAQMVDCPLNHHVPGVGCGLCVRGRIRYRFRTAESGAERLPLIHNLEFQSQFQLRSKFSPSMLWGLVDAVTGFVRVSYPSCLSARNHRIDMFQSICNLMELYLNILRLCTRIWSSRNDEEPFDAFRCQ